MSITGRIIRGLAPAAILSAALLPLPGNAIVWGEPDGEGHPNVGALILRFDGFSIPAPGVPENTLPICSGSVVARDDNRALFLTAGHCVEALVGAMNAFAPLNPMPVVSFSSDLHADPGVAVQVRMDALYGGASPLPPSWPKALGVLRDVVDIGLLVLEAGNAADLPAPVAVAPVGWLEALGSATFRKSELRAVGYGDDIVPPSPHTRAFVFGLRQVAHPRPLNFTSGWLIAHQHGPSGSSGIYFGDSGGPIFWVNPASGDETVVALASLPLGPADVSTVAQHYRVDTAEAAAFISAVMFAEGF